MQVLEIFNPLEKKHIAENVVRALLERPAVALGSLEPFAGVGIYAIYYLGSFPAYKKYKVRNSGSKFAAPIYVGKAMPGGARKGIDVQVGQQLYRRLQEHAESIGAAKNLDVSEFFCRFLAVDDHWIPISESLLIERYHPLWNVTLDGFGNHDPGKGRYEGACPLWDVVHPGREWALKCAASPHAIEEITKLIGEHMDSL